MIKNGILLHVYHLEAAQWEQLMWGDPAQDTHGTLPQFADLLLCIPSNEEVTSIIFSGPSQKDNLTEGAYTKQFLLDRIDGLEAFPRLRRKLQALTPAEHALFIERLHSLVLGPVIGNTLDEVTHAAQYLNQEAPADKVFQIAIASHAPRCLQNQILARSSNHIPNDQPWYVLPSEVCFADTSIKDVVILEPPHRGDDPMLHHQPTLPAAIRPYLGLEPQAKKQLIETITHTIQATTSNS